MGNTDKDLAPIVLFVYDRPSHTQKTIESLLENNLAQYSDLYIYSDAAKNIRQIENVSNVRNYIKSISGFKNLEIIEREENYGLANSIIDGVTNIVNSYGKIIVLEDDLIVSPFFLDYMNDSLNKYINTKQVFQVSGYMFPMELHLNYDALFLPLTTSWGWGTWEDKWKIFDSSASGYNELKNNNELIYNFNLNGSYDYYSMLEKQLNGRIDSWAIRWYLSVFFKRGMVLYPKKTMVINEGMDGSGAHKVNSNVFYEDSFHLEKITKYPDNIHLYNDIDSVFNKINNSNRKNKNILKKIRKYIQLW